MLTTELLPKDPSYQQSCELLDNAEDSFWLPILHKIASTHQLTIKKWHRIKQGGNALFAINEALIVKIVPPNWAYQAQAELNAIAILPKMLSLETPEFIANGHINTWPYILMKRMSGISLAERWPDLSLEQRKPIIQQVARFIKELHQLELPRDCDLKADWSSYCQQLIKDCVARHQRKGLPSSLVEQIPAYLGNEESYLDDGADFFIHMDLHPWNLMVTESAFGLKLTGVLDFGDAIVGRSRLLELNTPALFMCQGNVELLRTLFSTYGLLKKDRVEQLQKACMLVALLRPACDFNFVLEQVPVTGARNTWPQIAQQLFPIE